MPLPKSTQALGAKLPDGYFRSVTGGMGGAVGGGSRYTGGVGGLVSTGCTGTVCRAAVGEVVTAGESTGATLVAVDRFRRALCLIDFGAVVDEVRTLVGGF